MDETIRQTLQTAYGLRTLSLEAVQGGWSASAYAARTDRGGFFVKVYDKGRPSVRHWIARTGLYMPALLWLHAGTPLQGRISVPIATLDGGYGAEDAARLLLVFPLVDGETVCEARISEDQARQLAGILAELHAHGSEIPAPTTGLREDFALPFLEKLEAVLAARDMPEVLRRALAPYARALHQASAKLRARAEALRGLALPYVLCHTDVHGWNLMDSGGRLTLLDWEGLRLAPAESDLFSFTEGFFFDYVADVFFEAYCAARKGFAVHEDAMAYYRLRRRMEDIAEFAYSVAHDDLTPAVEAESIRLMQKECVALFGAG